MKEAFGPSAHFFVLCVAAGLVTVAIGIWRTLSDSEDYSFDWERILVALLEVAALLVALYKIDQWVALFRGGLPL